MPTLVPSLLIRSQPVALGSKFRTNNHRTRTDERAKEEEEIASLFSLSFRSLRLQQLRCSYTHAACTCVCGCVHNVGLLYKLAMPVESGEREGEWRNRVHRCSSSRS